MVTPDGAQIIATGAVARFEYTGGDPFQGVRSWLASLAAGACSEGGTADENLVAIVVFPFHTCDPDRDGLHRAWVPARIERRDASGRAHGVEWSASEAPRAWPSWHGTTISWKPRESTPDAWSRAVESSLDRIRSGSLRKVVLARSRLVHGSTPFDAERIFRALNESYPGCHRFRFETGDGTVFLGASPERLVALHAGRIEADAVAGTTSAENGAPLDDPKERLEHDIVVRDVVDALQPVADHVDAEPDPSLHRLRHVTHLRTRIRAAARAGTHVLDLAARIHPSPAVAGSPRDAALELIRTLEPSPRGWYAGPIGWASAAGEGEFTLGLRAALIRGHEAILQAGAGIVLGSDPDREWEECESKMRAMEEALHG
jgi:isochorismate synthase